MKFEIDSKKLSEEQRLFLVNLDMMLRQYVAKTLTKYPNLGVTLNWKVTDRIDKFWTLESNADLDIKDSFNVNSMIKSYLDDKLIVDFQNCSLLLNVKYRTIPLESEANSGQKFQSNGNSLGKKDEDGLPNFLPQTPRYTFDQIILPEEIKERILNDLNSIKCQDLIYNQRLCA